MKHKAEVTIDADPLTVWRYFDKPDNLPKWQPTLRSVRLRSGTAGHPDAETELVYEDKGRVTAVIEVGFGPKSPPKLVTDRLTVQVYKDKAPKVVQVARISE